MVLELRQLHEADGEEDADDPLHHAYRDPSSRPMRLPLRLSLGLVPFSTSVIGRAAGTELLICVGLWHDTNTQQREQAHNREMFDW